VPLAVTNIGHAFPPGRSSRGVALPRQGRGRSVEAWHDDLPRRPRSTAARQRHGVSRSCLKEVERAFAGRAEQEVVAALEQAIRSSGLEPDATGVRERARGIFPAEVERALVARSMGRYAALDPTATAVLRLGPFRATRSELLAEWTCSGTLTYGEAELLMALDETTPWRM
jgi:hypothetical protein